LKQENLIKTDILRKYIYTTEQLFIIQA